jgi:hypothetical protein
MPVPKIADNGVTSFAQVMPEKYRHKNPISAYRKYYLGGKSNIYLDQSTHTPLGSLINFRQMSSFGRKCVAECFYINCRIKLEGVNNEKNYKPFDFIFIGVGGGCLELF